MDLYIGLSLKAAEDRPESGDHPKHRTKPQPPPSPNQPPTSSKPRESSWRRELASHTRSNLRIILHVFVKVVTLDENARVSFSLLWLAEKNLKMLSNIFRSSLNEANQVGKV